MTHTPAGQPLLRQSLDLAAAAGASGACALDGVPGITTVTAGDTTSLRHARQNLTAAQKASSAAETSR